jgi:hypothetical protein
VVANEGPWIQAYYTQSDDKYNVYHGSFDQAADNVFLEMNKTRGNIAFWPRGTPSFPAFDLNTHSMNTPGLGKYGPFGVHDGSDKPALTTFYNGVSTIFGSRFWSGSRNVASADTKIGKVDSSPTGYKKLNGTGYLVLELPELTISYEYIAGVLTLIRRGQTSTTNDASLIEKIKWQGYFFGSSHGTYNPRIEFEASTDLGYVKEGRVIRSVANKKVYIVIGDGTKNWANIHWAMVEDVYWGEHSRTELHTEDWNIYVSATLPAGSVRHTTTRTDADILAHVLTEGNDAGGLEITGAADGSTPTSLTTQQQVDAKIAALIRSGSGSPEGAVTAPPGTLYTNTLGGVGTTLYVKETGTGNTGWIAK